MRILGVVIEKDKKPAARRPGNRTLKKRLEDAGYRLVLKRVEAGDTAVCQALIEKSLGREIPKLDPIESMIAQKQNTFLVKAVDAYLEEPGVAESLGKQMLERHLDIDLTPTTDNSQTTPQMSPIERFTEQARQVRALKKELGIDDGGFLGFLRGLINADTVNAGLKLAQTFIGGKAAPAPGLAEAQAPKLPAETNRQARQGAETQAERIDRESLPRETQPPQGESMKTSPAPGQANDLAGSVDYGFKAADTDVGGRTPKVDPERRDSE